MELSIAEPVDIVAKFVDLVLSKNWKEINELSEEETETILRVLSDAGFEVDTLVYGNLKGYYRDQDGSALDSYPINTLCPFIVKDQERKRSYSATQWLDCILQKIVTVERNRTNRDTIRKLIQKEIERSVPMKPIQLTAEGDFLCEYPPNGCLAEHTRDNDKLPSCVGVHKICNGWVDRRRTTETHDVLVCRQCHLRVLIPKEIQTYGELRRTLGNFLAI